MNQLTYTERIELRNLQWRKLIDAQQRKSHELMGMIRKLKKDESQLETPIMSTDEATESMEKRIQKQMERIKNRVNLMTSLEIRLNGGS